MGRTDIRDNALRKTISWKSCCPGLDCGLTVTAATFFILLSVAPAAASKAMHESNSSSSSRSNCTAPSAAGVGGSGECGPEVRNESTCFTAACNVTATMILSNMDRSVEPCDNFYKYACGGFINSTKLPDDRSRINAYTIIEDIVDEQLVAILEAEIVPDEPRTHKLLKKYYRSCMNESAIEARGVQPLVASLRSIGGWPMVDGAASWNESNFDWVEAIHKLRKAGHYFEHFIETDVGPSLRNATRRVIWVKPPTRSTFNYYRTKDSHSGDWLAYSNHIIDVAASLGARDNTTAAVQLALDFEFNLMMTNYSSTQWHEYISGILPSTVSVNESEVVIVITRPSYFEQLDKLMSKTPKIVQANYLAQSVALNSIDYLGKAMLKKRQQFLTPHSGVTEASPRSEVCIKSASSMEFAINFAMNRLSADGKRNVASIAEGTRKALRELLETASWIDPISKSKVLQKVEAMNAFIAYPDQLSDDKLDKIYENLDVDEDHYYENVHKLSLWNTDYKFGQLRYPIDRSDVLGENPLLVSPAYEVTKNTFKLPAGILQGAFFDEDRPRYLNYGAIGTLIGHEMTHAFGPDGRRRDWKGDLTALFEPSSEKEYLKREKCIVEWYSNLTIEELGFDNGGSTKDENIADTIGMKAARVAYKNWVAKNGVEEKLPGIDMTPNQLFWMIKANLRCEKYSLDFLLESILKDEHSLGEFRITGPLSNIPQFAEDFACPPGSNMNPTQRCSFL